MSPLAANLYIAIGIACSPGNVHGCEEYELSAQPMRFADCVALVRAHAPEYDEYDCQILGTPAPGRYHLTTYRGGKAERWGLYLDYESCHERHDEWYRNDTVDEVWCIGEGEGE